MVKLKVVVFMGLSCGGPVNLLDKIGLTVYLHRRLGAGSHFWRGDFETTDSQSVWPHRLVHNIAHGIRQLRHGVQPFGHGIDPLVGQFEAIEQRRG